MKLLIFKADGGDYGAMTFEESGEKLKDLYATMLKQGVKSICQEDDGDGNEWVITLEGEVEVKSKAEAQSIEYAMSIVAEIIGDYDSRKGVNYYTLISRK